VLEDGGTVEQYLCEETFCETLSQLTGKQLSKVITVTGIIW